MNQLSAEPRQGTAAVPSLVVCTRFGLRVRNREWLEHRLALIAAITAPSLLAQHDQSFHWVVLVDDGLPRDIRADLESMVRPFGCRAFVYQRPVHTSESLVELVKSRRLAGTSHYLLTGRLDDDDAWSTAMVGAVRAHVGRWLKQPGRASGVSLTFQDGLEWVMYEMLDVERLLKRDEHVVHAAAVRRYRLPFVGTSVFVCSTLSDGATALAGAHSRVAQLHSEKRGFATEVVATDSPMWLCCRHKQTGSGIRKAQGEEVDFTLADLAAAFGIDQRRAQEYLDEADRYRYTVLKAPIGKKRKLLVELFHVHREMEDPGTSADRQAQLRQRKEKLAAEVDELETAMLGDPLTTDACSSAPPQPPPRV